MIFGSHTRQFKKKQDLTAHDIEGMFLLGNDFGRQ